MSAEFCDTNIIAYAHDTSAGLKRQRAERLVDGLWRSGDGALRIQVLQELYVTLTRKLAQRVSAEEAREIVAELGNWHVVAPMADDVLRAIDRSIRWQVSFWDAMLLTAARKADATILWSEDLNDGQSYDGVVVRNPFLGA